MVTANGDMWKGHISGGRDTHHVPFMQNHLGQELLLGEVFRMGHPPATARERGEHPSTAGALLCRMGGQVLSGQISRGLRWRWVTCWDRAAHGVWEFTEINLPSEPSTGGTFNQNAEFKRHYMKRYKRAKLNTFSAKTQCFQWSSWEVRSILSWHRILPCTGL